MLNLIVGTAFLFGATAPLQRTRALRVATARGARERPVRSFFGKAGPWPGEVGPFFVEGAMPGDTLVVKVSGCVPIVTSPSPMSLLVGSAALPGTAVRVC